MHTQKQTSFADQTQIIQGKQEGLFVEFNTMKTPIKKIIGKSNAEFDDYQ